MTGAALDELKSQSAFCSMPSDVSGTSQLRFVAAFAPKQTGTMQDLNSLWPD